jgi:hypothetical protein
MIKSVAFLLLVAIIVMLMTACYFFERATDLDLARPQKKKFHPRRLDEYLSSIGDKKINKLLRAKHHEPIHPN